MLDIYGNYCLGEKTDCKFTRDESFKIAAYITYYLKLIDLENDKRSGSDEYLIINDMLFRIIGALEDKEGSQRSKARTIASFNLMPIEEASSLSSIQKGSCTNISPSSAFVSILKNVAAPSPLSRISHAIGARPRPFGNFVG